VRRGRIVSRDVEQLCARYYPRLGAELERRGDEFCAPRCGPSIEELPPVARPDRLRSPVGGAPGLRPRRARVGVPVAVPSLWIAATNSAAVANRSAGSFSSAMKTAASTDSGTLLRRGPIGAGSSVSTLATMAWAVGPVKGGSPMSIS
jgi:hypothetical protein